MGILLENEIGTLQRSSKTDLYQGHDYYNIDELLDEDHILARDAVRDWVKQEVSPIIEDCAEKGVFPRHLIKGLGEIGAFGPSLPVEYGGGGMDEIAYGIIMQELERGDSGVRSAASVQGSLVMYPIFKYASEAQKRKYLPKLGSGEFVGCFGLTEPDHGSNPGGMVTNIKDDGDCYILNGAKMWITNSPIADIAVVWAKDEEGKSVVWLSNVAGKVFLPLKSKGNGRYVHPLLESWFLKMLECRRKMFFLIFVGCVAPCLACRKLAMASLGVQSGQL